MLEGIDSRDYTIFLEAVDLELAAVLTSKKFDPFYKKKCIFFINKCNFIILLIFNFIIYIWYVNKKGNYLNFIIIILKKNFIIMILKKKIIT